jgi:O-antigen ligase
MTAKLVQGLRRLVGDPPETSARTSWSFWLYAGHLLSIAAIAASNILLGAAVLAAPWKRAKPWLARGLPLLLALGLYLIGLIGSILASHSPATSARAASDIFNFLAPVLALLLIRREQQVRLIIKALILLGCLIAIQTLVQYALGANHIENRPVGPFSHYMTLAGFLVFGDCLLLSWIVFGRGWRRWWSWATLALIQLALIASLTRNAWITVAIIAVVLMALRAPRLLLVAAPVAMVIVLVLPGNTVSRIASIVDYRSPSNYDRLCMVYAGAHMVRDKPLLGQGPRMARERYSLYRHPSAPRDWVPHLHNSFLSVAAERGLVSLAALLALLFIPVRESIRRLREADPATPVPVDLHAAVLLVVMASVISGMFEDYWRDTEIQRMVFFALALPFCLKAPSPKVPSIKVPVDD